MTFWMKLLENVLRKGENAANQHFTPFQTMFSTLSKTKIIIKATFDLSSANSLNLVWSKKKLYGKRVRTLCIFLPLTGYQERRRIFLDAVEGGVSYL